MAKETAEQKLLKMMQKGGDSVAAKSTSKSRKLSLSFNIGMVNQLLIVGILVCLVLLVMEMRSGFSLLNQTVDFTDDAKVAQNIGDAALPTGNNVDYYLDQINSRNIFKPYEAQTTAAASEQSLGKRLSKYKLVGVAWLDLPETASIMIEDTQNKQTYFLKQGEQLEGVTVKTIYTDRAVFSYENEETTIKL